AAATTTGAGGGAVPSAVFWTALPTALLLGLAPAVCFAVGFKRRTDALWKSVKDRDAEIVRMCHEQQASQGGISALAARRGAPLRPGSSIELFACCINGGDFGA
ncbi:unnamed protein product, partial [Ectocarpus sp. 12 AP-2014]